ncbi:ATP-binding protein [Chitinophaga sp. 22321]|uniref:ATP-binding protein n=1 Tax=Chitinophaga hostae TaxID=2831022 RepID=A0ABS5J431_9BACT|nr:ATP-binding protein [Chitinophaga hostae]MBS0029992.1 ATP-binding protein [Chitinophaga hostae]
MYWKKKEPATSPEEKQAAVSSDVIGQSFLAESMSALLKVAASRLDHHFGKVNAFVQPAFDITDDDSPLARYVIDNHLSIEEYITLMLALSPHVHPDLFTPLIRQYMPRGGDFPEFGGVKGTNYRGIIPTGETALFLLAGMNMDMRLQYSLWLRGEVPGSGKINGAAKARSKIFQSGVLTLEEMREGEPEMSGRLQLSQARLTEFLTGRKWRPSFGSGFPATLLETKMEWNDIVISHQTERELKMIRYWLKYHGHLESDANLGRRTKPGYRALFYGPPGTGKTLTASLLGKQFGLDVYRIDLSLVVSKYIGETEKNLQQIFDRAEDWILFFDEADALFGKRTNVQSAHDRFANQEVSYLLQKIEEHPGLVILATNFRNNMDQAFIRRFQTVVPFNAPNEQESLALWNNTMPADIPWSGDISLQDFARKYELTGASILNIVQSASIRALSEDRPIETQDLLEGIQHEYYKNGKSV